MPDQNIIKKIITSIRKVLDPDKVILFGSQATGKARPESDYDFLVIKAGIKDEIGIAQDIYECLLEMDEDLALDIVVASAETVEKYRNSAGSIIKPAMKEGVVVYGQC